MILIAGSANLDFVVQAPHIPMPGETVLGHSFQNFPGGKGANQAVACARAGNVATQFLGAFGNDTLAQPLLDSLRSAGVQVHAIRRPESPTGTAFICVDAHGENAITVVPGANALLEPQHLPPLAGVSHLLLQLETPLATLQAYAQKARAAGVKVVLNAAPAQREALAVLPDVDILIVNEGELALLTGHEGTVSTQMQALQVPTVITTLGARGCIARSKEGYTLQTALPVKVVDTTAAGDTFCGALVAALADKQQLDQALRWASAAAALACTQAGAQSSIPAQHEIKTLLDTFTPCASALTTLAAYCGLSPAQQTSAHAA